jgi:hypothetical protein
MMNIVLRNSLFALKKNIKFSLKCFSSKPNPRRKEEAEEFLRDSWEKSDKKVVKKEKIEEIYTAEEMEAFHSQDKSIKIMEISEKNFKKINKYKKWALYFNLPLTVTIPILNEIYLSGWAETSWKANMVYHMLFAVDVMCFAGALGGLGGLKNVVILCNYLTKDRIVEFTKLDFRRRPYKVLYSPDELKRIPRSAFTPFLSLKRMDEKEDFSMSGIGKWNDIKLFNTIFPHPKQAEGEKTENKENKDEKKEETK